VTWQILIHNIIPAKKLELGHPCIIRKKKEYEFYFWWNGTNKQRSTVRCTILSTTGPSAMRFLIHTGSKRELPI
jgi:hypothetical protein